MCIGVIHSDDVGRCFLARGRGRDEDLSCVYWVDT